MYTDGMGPSSSTLLQQSGDVGAVFGADYSLVVSWLSRDSTVGKGNIVTIRFNGRDGMIEEGAA